MKLVRLGAREALFPRHQTATEINGGSVHAFAEPP